MQKVRSGILILFMFGIQLVTNGVAYAVPGTPDDVPGATLLFPFFKVNPRPTLPTRQDTLIVVTNTGNPPAAFATANLPATTAHTIVHFTVWTVKSQPVYNFNVTLTPHDVFSCSLLDLLVNPTNQTTQCGQTPASATVISQLTVGNILTGYVTADVVTAATTSAPGQPGYPFADWNLLIGHEYIVDLPAGSAVGFNAVSIESDSRIPGNLGHQMTSFGEEPVGFYLNRCLDAQGGGVSTPCLPNTTGSVLYGNRERLDGSAGTISQVSKANPAGPITAANDRPLGLLLRYFSLSAIAGRSEIWLWKDRNTTGQAANVSVTIYDEEEIVTARTLPIPDQVNVISTDTLIPSGTPGGWLRIRFGCENFGYCGYNSTNPAGVSPSTPWITATNPPVIQTPIQAVAYSLQSANSANAALRWDAAFPAHRQYGVFRGGQAAE